MGEAKRRMDAITNGSHKACGNCEFFKRTQFGQAMGNCHGDVPQTVFMGFAKHPITGEQQPVMNSYWPQVQDISPACRHWSVRVNLPDVKQIDLTKLETEDAEGTA